MNETLTFKSSPLALAERRQLLRDLRFGLGLALILLCLAFARAPMLVQVIAWSLSLLLIWDLYKLDGEGLVAPYASRELRIQGNALELVKGRFTRLLFFEQLEQFRMLQSRDERVLALELVTLDGTVRLEGYENMEALFSALNMRKPARVMLEVEEHGWRPGGISGWSRAAFGLGVAALLLIWLLGPSSDFLKKASGLLLIAQALFVGIWQPFSHRKGKKAAIAEVAMAVVFILFGILFLN